MSCPCCHGNANWKNGIEQNPWWIESCLLRDTKRSLPCHQGKVGTRTEGGRNGARDEGSETLRTCLGYPGLVNPIPRRYSIPFNGHSKWIDSIRNKMNGFPLWLRHSILVFLSPWSFMVYHGLPPCKYHKLAITIIDKHLEKAFHWLIASVDGVFLLPSMKGESSEAQNPITKVKLR
jgi:hypothetical protein